MSYTLICTYRAYAICTKHNCIHYRWDARIACRAVATGYMYVHAESVGRTMLEMYSQKHVCGYACIQMRACIRKA